MPTRRKNEKRFLGVIFVVVFGYVTMVGGLVFAQEKFPTKPITNIVSWSAGGGVDLLARALQPLLEKVLGQTVIIVNRPGGGASIGFNEIANAAPDGYTIGMVSNSVHTLKYTVKDTNIDYVRFEPIVYVGYSPSTIYARKEAPWNNLKDVLDYAKANPGKLRVGNSGYGGIHHIAAIGMEQAARVKFIHVPYKGTAPSIPAVLGGHIDAIVTGITDCLHLIRGGKIKALGTAAPERSKFIPETQTFKELGIDADFAVNYSWAGPKGISKERVTILFEAFRKSAETKEFKDFCESQGVTVSMKGPEDYAKFLGEEDKKLKELITIGGIKPE